MFVLLLRILSLDLVVIPFIGRRGIGSEREGKEIGKGGTGEVGMLLECNSVSVAEDTAEIGPSESSYFVVFEWNAEPNQISNQKQAVNMQFDQKIH